MNTRTEKIGSVEYCTYCGKSLRDYNCGYAIYPNESLTCNCEKAKEELYLYKRLKDLYNVPLAESLIDKKVQRYRNELLGIKEPTYVSNIESITYLDAKCTLDPIDDNECLHNKSLVFKEEL